MQLHISKKKWRYMKNKKTSEISNNFRASEFSRCPNSL